MSLTDMLGYIRPELLVRVPVLYFIGLAAKKSEAVADKRIPLILGAAGIGLSCLYVLATSALGSYQEALLAAFAAITQGILAAGCSVYANEVIKQAKKVE